MVISIYFQDALKMWDWPDAIFRHARAGPVNKDINEDGSLWYRSPNVRSVWSLVVGGHDMHLATALG
jgi:hypothetical protein